MIVVIAHIGLLQHITIKTIEIQCCLYEGYDVQFLFALSNRGVVQVESHLCVYYIVLNNTNGVGKTSD